MTLRLYFMASKKALVKCSLTPSETTNPLPTTSVVASSDRSNTSYLDVPMDLYQKQSIKSKILPKLCIIFLLLQIPQLPHPQPLQAILHP